MAEHDSSDPDGDFPFETHVLAEGFAYWKSKSAGGLLPARADIKPTQIPRLLPNIILLDVLREPELDFRYRLMGTRIVEHSSADYTGRRYSEIEHQRRPSVIWENCRRVVDRSEPLYARTPYTGPQSEFRRLEDVILPLADDGVTVDTLLVLIKYLPKA
jgi:hypothetical protein